MAKVKPKDKKMIAKRKRVRKQGSPAFAVVLKVGPDGK